MKFRALSLVALSLVAVSAHAGIGDRLFSAGGEVTAQIVKYTGNPGYNNFLRAVAPVSVDLGYSKDWMSSPAPVSLGTIAAGTELKFSLTNPDNYTFFTGPASGNPDGVAHANVTDLGGGSYRIDWEDLTGGGDLNYGDAAIVVNGIYAEPVPEPATMAALGLGLAALARRRRAR